MHRQTAEQGRHGRVFELAAEAAAGRLLERLQTVQDQQRPLPGNQRGEFAALLPRVFRDLAGGIEPPEGGDEELVGTRTGLIAAALAVEAPVKHTTDIRPLPLCLTRVPVEHQPGLPLAALPDEGHDVDFASSRIGSAPGFVQQQQFLLAPHEFPSCDVESGGRDARR